MTRGRDTILVTATVDVGETPFVKLRSSRERLFQYLCTLVALFEVESIGTVVFCENSGTSYDFARARELAVEAGKTLEVLVMRGNANAEKFGKGYGEGELIEHAINSSRHLGNDADFYKLTGRNFVVDLEKVCGALNGQQNVFRMPAWGNRSNAANTCETRFYKSNVAFFKAHLLHSYRRVNDRAGSYIEHAYYQDLAPCTVGQLPADLRFVGYSGTDNNLVDGFEFSGAVMDSASRLLR